MTAARPRGDGFLEASSVVAGAGAMRRLGIAVSADAAASGAMATGTPLISGSGSRMKSFFFLPVVGSVVAGGEALVACK